MKRGTVIVLISLIFLIAIIRYFSLYEDNKTCSDFSSWVAAQKAFELNPIQYSNLDGDHDQVACEFLRVK